MTGKSITALAALLFTILVTVSACAGIISNDETLRYKMTVTINTPEGERVGSAVREVRKSTERSVLPEQGGTLYSLVKGEAVTIDLGEEGYVFALQTMERDARQAFKFLGDKAGTIVTLPLNEYPTFVRFKDPKNPDTVEILLDTSNCDSVDMRGDGHTCVKDTMGTELGNQYSIKSITIQRVNEPAHFEIKEIMPKFDGKFHYIKSFQLCKGCE